MLISLLYLTQYNIYISKLNIVVSDCLSLKFEKFTIFQNLNSTTSHLKEELKIKLKRGSPTRITTDTSMYCISNLSMNCFTYSEHDNVNNRHNNEFSHPVTLVKPKRQCKKFIKRKIRAASIYVDER